MESELSIGQISDSFSESTDVVINNTERILEIFLDCLISLIILSVKYLIFCENDRLLSHPLSKFFRDVLLENVNQSQRLF